MTSILFRAVLELTDVRLLAAVSVALGLVLAAVALSLSGNTAAVVVSGAAMAVAAFVVLGAEVLILLANFQSGLTQKPAIAFNVGYSSERAVARLTRTFSERKLSFFEAGERLNSSAFRIFSRLGVSFKGRLLVSRDPFVIVRVTPVAGGLRLSLFFDSSNASSATLAEVLKTKLKMG
ncbi:hypothetical protein AUJ14_05405 [Candidatus Micrarchaeota archaeon CG1_02_55_22]|nr:MAG: hypothetical protein AUJ14_05405 [Candidatus Micrarchaeota archaeon CG1_02_55_22]